MQVQPITSNPYFFQNTGATKKAVINWTVETVFPFAGEPTGHIRAFRAYDKQGIMRQPDKDIYIDLFHDLRQAQEFLREVLKPLPQLEPITQYAKAESDPITHKLEAKEGTYHSQAQSECRAYHRAQAQSIGR